MFLGVDRDKTGRIGFFGSSGGTSGFGLQIGTVPTRSGRLASMDQPRSATTNTLASMLLYLIWVTRNKTVHREGLCDREGTVAIRIQLYFYSYVKSCIKLDYHVAKIKASWQIFESFGLACARSVTAIACIFYFKNLWKILKSYKRLL